MSTAENKLNLVQLIVESNDNDFISKILEYASSLKKQKNVVDSELPQELIEELEQTMKELDNGTDLGISHEVMIHKFRTEYPGLRV